MDAGTRVLLTVFVAVLAVHAPVHAQPTPDPRLTPVEDSLFALSDSARGIHWMRTAAERGLMLDLEGERRVWRLAFEADPEAYQAQNNLLWHTVRPEARAALREELRQLAADGSDSAACLVTELDAAPGGYRAVFEALKRLEAEGRTSLCLDEKLAHWAGSMTPEEEWREAELAYARRVAETAQGPAKIGSYARLLAEEGRYEEARRQMRRAIRDWDHPLARNGTLMTLADVHRMAGDSARAVALVTAVHAAVERDGRPGLRWNFLWNLERWHHAQYRTDSLIAIRRERVRLARTHGHWRHEIEDLYTLAGQTDGLSGEERLTLLDRGIHLADSVGWTEKVAYLRFARGTHLRQRGELVAAEADLSAAFAAARRLGHPAIEVDILRSLLRLYEAQGEYARASRLGDEYIAAAERHMIPGARVMSRRDAGRVRWKAGWHAAGDAAFADMVRVIERHGVYRQWAGEYYERIGRLEDALEAYRRATREDPAHGERRLALAGMARVYEALGYPDSALAAAGRHDTETMYAASFPLLPELMLRQGSAEEAIAIGREWVMEGRRRATVPFLVEALLGLGEIQLKAGNPEPAVRSAREADSLASVLDRRELQADARVLEARALMAVGRPADALARLAEMSAQLDVTLSARLELELAMTRGDVHAALGEIPAALVSYGVAAEAAERVAAELRHDPGRSRFRDVHQSPYDAAIDLLLDSEATSPSSSSKSAAGRLADWLQRRKATSLGSSSSSPPPRTGLDELQRRLVPGYAILDYVVTETNAAVLVVRTSGTTTVRLPFAPSDLGDLVDRIERPLTTSYLGQLDLARTPFPAEVARELHELLVAPVLPYLERVDVLYVVPDGILHRVPFAALIARPPGDGGRDDDVADAFLLDRFALSYLPASHYTPEAFAGNNGHLRGSSVTAIGVDAPGWDRELAAITEVWGESRIRVLESSHATETSVRALGGAEILHFAVHAEANRRDPLASHLRLVPDEEHDGYLHFSEIGEASIDTELVVLSACESTGGTVFRGEGAMGLARAFLASGSRLVVASLWPVGPSAAELMGRFHRELAGGSSPREALRYAQRALADDPESAHPFHWAGFLVIEGR